MSSLKLRSPVEGSIGSHILGVVVALLVSIIVSVRGPFLCRRNLGVDGVRNLVACGVCAPIGEVAFSLQHVFDDVGSEGRRVG